jgi:hypothetical protein
MSRSSNPCYKVLLRLFQVQRLAFFAADELNWKMRLESSGFSLMGFLVCSN